MTKEKVGLYPTYDVLALQDEWDTHTRRIVTRRLVPFTYKLLSDWEQGMLKVIAQHLAYEERNEILDWIVFHMDEQLTKTIGEGERKPEIPPQKELILSGLKALDVWAKRHFLKAFSHLKMKHQDQILRELQQGELTPIDIWNSEFQRALFQKLAGLVIDAYYSHPWVWSEIGYGGPAYPRGYVRVELGLTDPWEPKQADEDSQKGS